MPVFLNLAEARPGWGGNPKKIFARWQGIHGVVLSSPLGHHHPRGGGPPPLRGTRFTDRWAHFALLGNFEKARPGWGGSPKKFLRMSRWDAEELRRVHLCRRI